MQSTDEKIYERSDQTGQRKHMRSVRCRSGWVIVYVDKIIGRGYNRRTIRYNTLGACRTDHDQKSKQEDE